MYIHTHTYIYIYIYTYMYTCSSCIGLARRAQGDLRARATRGADARGRLSASQRAGHHLRAHHEGQTAAQAVPLRVHHHRRGTPDEERSIKALGACIDMYIYI